MSSSRKMHKFTITLLSIVILSSSLSSCSSNTGELSFMVNFPKSSPVLNEPEKIELKKKIAIKNSNLFTDEELEEFGALEIEIK